MQLSDHVFYDVDLEFNIFKLAFGLFLHKSLEVEEVLPNTTVNNVLKPVRQFDGLILFEPGLGSQPFFDVLGVGVDLIGEVHKENAQKL